MLLMALAQAAFEADVPSRHARRVIAGRDPLSGLDQCRRPIAEPGHHERRGQEHADGRAGDRGGRRPQGNGDPRVPQRRVGEVVGPEGDRSRQHQESDEALHSQTVPAAALRADRTEVPNVRPGGTGGVTHAGAVVGAVCATAILRRCSRQRVEPRDPRRPAIARAGRVGRPVRRPSDQSMAIRRDIGGATRETCTRVPGHQARGFSFSSASAATRSAACPQR